MYKAIIILLFLLLAAKPAFAQISPDGSTLVACTGGSLTTSAGTWTFSNTTASGGYSILLNGQSAAGGSAIELGISGGNLYAYNNSGTWWKWNGSGWTQVSSPGLPIPSSVPSCQAKTIILNQQIIVIVTNPISITPGDGSLTAFGHIWKFSDIQDDWTGNSLLRDGKYTSLHGIRLDWDGANLSLTDHHPYPFNPANGVPWTPPQRTITINDCMTMPSGVKYTINGLPCQ